MTNWIDATKEPVPQGTSLLKGRRDVSIVLIGNSTASKLGVRDSPLQSSTNPNLVDVIQIEDEKDPVIVLQKMRDDETPDGITMWRTFPAIDTEIIVRSFHVALAKS